jgi:hypothetical protein
MSSNELHITRANYEAYFLMYVDGELTPAQCNTLEAFAALHPDLQEELDLLLTTKLDAETVSFDKAFLMADSMKQNVIDESLLLYIDNELKGEEKKKIEEQLANDSTYQYQYNLLLQTKLPAEVISYPNKAELYRKTERRIRPVIWYRAAAAVFVLMASGYMWYLNQNTVPQSSSVAQAPDKQTTPAAPSNTNADVAKAPTEVIAAPVETEQTNKDDERVAVSTNATASIAHPAANTNNQSDASVRSSVSVSNNPASTNTTDAAVISQPIVSIERTQETRPQQIINTNPVTTAPVIAFNGSNAVKEVTGDESGYHTAALESENNKRGGSVKGFLRKATRFIERRTGVATTNEDDELLIGAVAIKLK